MDRSACRTTCLLRSQNRSARAGCDGLSRLDTSTRAQRRKPFGAASFEILENSHTVSRNRGRGRRVVTLASYAPADRFVIFTRAGGCAPFFIAAPIGTLSTIPMISRSAAPGDYKTVGEMPERDGDRMYRIKSPLEEHERVVGESLLVRSEGHLPDGAMAQRSRRGSITLPKLRIALRIDADDEPDGWSVVSVPGH